MRNREIEFKYTKIEKCKVEIYRKYGVENAAFENNVCEQKILFLFI